MPCPEDGVVSSVCRDDRIGRSDVVHWSLELDVVSVQCHSRDDLRRCRRSRHGVVGAPKNIGVVRSDRDGDLTIAALRKRSVATDSSLELVVARLADYVAIGGSVRAKVGSFLCWSRLLCDCESVVIAANCDCDHCCHRGFLCVGRESDLHFGFAHARGLAQDKIRIVAGGGPFLVAQDSELSGGGRETYVQFADVNTNRHFSFLCDIEGKRGDTVADEFDAGLASVDVLVGFHIDDVVGCLRVVSFGGYCHEVVLVHDTVIDVGFQLHVDTASLFTDRELLLGKLHVRSLFLAGRYGQHGQNTCGESF